MQKLQHSILWSTNTELLNCSVNYTDTAMDFMVPESRGFILTLQILKAELYIKPQRSGTTITLRASQRRSQSLNIYLYLCHFYINLMKRYR